MPLILSPPGLIMVMGAPGTGKSSLCRALEGIVHAAYIDKDIINEAFRPKDMDKNSFRSSEYYAKNVRSQSYEVMYSLAISNLRRSTSVILDSPHIKESSDPMWRSYIEGMARDNGAKLHLLQTTLCIEKLYGRILERNASRDYKFLSDKSAFDARVSSVPPDITVNWPGQLVYTIDTSEQLTQKDIIGILGYLLRE